MPFQPINDDHAIQSATVAIVLTKPLSWSSLEAIIKSPLDWRGDLPALELSQMLDVQLNSQTGAPVNRITRGVEFSHKRPDGSASWQVSLLGTEIKITTTIYTRWKATWAKAGDILLGVVGQLAMLEKEKGISTQAISLQVTDVFFTADENPDYSELFARSEQIPSAILRQGRLWHSHTGWFSPRPRGDVLNQLNIDVQPGADASGIVSIPDDRIKVVIQHNQIFRPSPPIPFHPDQENEFQDVLLTEVPLMHDNNKSIMRALLTEAMRDRIKVNA